jgi:nucleoside 2-deoxyribosyltransferase
MTDEVMRKVFLGYSRSDRDVAEEFRAGLSDCGIEVWSDQAIAPGAGMAESIAAGMAAADTVVFLLGKQTDRTAWTSVEVGMASALGKKVIPVLVDRNAEVPVTLRGIQWLEATEQSARNVQIDQLCKLLRQPPVPRSMAEGLKATEQASRALEVEELAYQQDYHRRLATLMRFQIIIGIPVLLASGAGLLAASVADAVVAVGIASGVIAAFIAAFAVLFIESRRSKADG